MAKVRLRDDPYPISGPTRTVVEGDLRYDLPPRAWWQDPPADPAVPDPTGTQPIVEVWSRVREGFDDDGVALFSWSLSARGPAVVVSKREEFDPRAGFTLVEGTAMLLLPAPDPLAAGTLTVTTDDGGQVVLGPPSAGVWGGTLGIGVAADGVPYVYGFEGGPLVDDTDGTPAVLQEALAGVEARLPHETMMVRDVATDARYRVTSAQVTGRRLDLRIVRIDAKG